MEVDYIIVGQGLAGSTLSNCLMKAGQRVMVIDNEHQQSATKVASGIINPITGRRFVKSWLIDELIPKADELYAEMEGLTGQQFFEERRLFRVADSQQEVNDIMVKSDEPAYDPYFESGEQVYVDSSKILNPLGGFYFNSGRALDVNLFLDIWQKHLQNHDSLLLEEFDYEQLSIASGVRYKDIEAQAIIFCEGIGVLQNPWFKWLPFRPAKGEALVVRIPGLEMDDILIGNGIILSLGENLYYIGSTHESVDYEMGITEKGRLKLEDKIKSKTPLPYEMVDHMWAVRPATRDRRPFLGQHPEHSNLYIFNGMGTKGVSLSPYFAEQLVDHLLNQKPLMPEADIQRNIEFYATPGDTL